MFLILIIAYCYYILVQLYQRQKCRKLIEWWASVHNIIIKLIFLLNYDKYAQCQSARKLNS